MKSTQIRNLELRRLKWILKKVSDESDRNKILAAIAIKEGKQVAEVSRFFKISRQTIYSWIKVPERYFIFPKSRPRETRGRPAKWNSDMDRLLEKSLKKKPFDFNISALNWTIPVLITHFYNQTGNKFSISTFHRKLHQHRLAWKRPRYSLTQDPDLLKKSVVFVLE